MARVFTRQLREGQITLARGAGSLIGAANVVLAADAAIGTDVANPTWQPASIDCTGYDSIFVGFDVAGGTAPTATIEALFRAPEEADGSRWKRILLGARDGVTLAALASETTGALGAASSMVELRVFGHAFVFLRISAVGGTPAGSTGWIIVAKPGQIRPTPGRRFNG